MQAWTCSLYFTQTAQPANEQLLFINLLLPTGAKQPDKACGIPKGFGQSVRAGKREYFGGDRWFAGYFASGDRDGYFFASKGDSCGLKSYTLTIGAAIPGQLPPPDDPGLQQTDLHP